VTLFLILLAGCSESYLDEQPPHIITAESLYKDLEGFQNGLNGLNATVRREREGRSSGNYLRAEMFMNGTDNMCANTRDGFGRVAEAWGEINSPYGGAGSDEIIQNFKWLYEIINAANTIINRAENPEVDWRGGSDTEEINKMRILAQARAIRAWAYRHLTYCFGDVPLSLEESLGSNIKTDWIRTPVKEVREQMKSDWLYAENYVDIEPTNSGDITKGAIQHYLAELYLVLNKPDSALFYANKCINTPEYQLITNRYGVRAGEPGVPFMDMFYDGNSNRNQGNKEALWVWQWEYETIGGGENIMRRWSVSKYDEISINNVRPLLITVERGGRGRGRMGITKWAIELYEPQDDRGSQFALRKYFILKDETENSIGYADRLPPGYDFGDTIWLDYSEPLTYLTRSRTDWPFSRKFEWAEPNDPQIARQYNDQVYLRLAETYLLKAEAQFRLGDLDGAAGTLNIIRQRANTTPIAAEDVTIDFILDERSRELYLEEHRRYTLLRTGKWLERTALYNLNGGQHIIPRDTLFPIPQEVIDANLTADMPQNPGFN